MKTIKFFNLVVINYGLPVGSECTRMELNWTAIDIAFHALDGSRGLPTSVSAGHRSC